MEVEKKSDTATHVGKTEIRLIDESDLQTFSDLLDICFIPNKTSHFFDDFPVWASRGIASIKRYGLFADGRLASTACVRLASVRIVGTAERLPIAIIGAVATHPDFRGTGYATGCVEACTAWAEAQGAAFAILWGSQIEMYQRLGFDLIGAQHRVVVGDLPFVESTPPVRISTGWNPALYHHFMVRTEGLVHSEKELGWISAHKNVQWVWSGEAERPTAFLAYNRGIDLPGMIHEWGGQRDAIRPLIATVAKKQPQLQILFHPTHKRMLGLEQYNIPAEHLGMVKPLKMLKEDPRLSALKDLTPTEWAEAVLGTPERSALLPVWMWGLDSA